MSPSKNPPGASQPSSRALVRSAVGSVFQDAQKSTASHRKLSATLYAIAEECLNLPSPVQSSDGIHSISGEECFTVELLRCAVQVLAIKKGERAGDNIVKFLDTFFKYMHEKGEQGTNT